MKITIGDQIADILDEYKERAEEAIIKCTNDVSRQAVKDLKRVDKFSSKATGEYNKSWTRTKSGKGFIVHNKDHYRLTHLLEKGHAKVGGGRVAAIPHIEPIEEKCNNELIESIKGELE